MTLPKYPSLFLLISILFVCYNSQSQTISGQVLDSVTLEPLPYVTIKIASKNKGTLTNLEGRFKIEMDSLKFKKDSIQISFLSYKQTKIPIASLKDSIIIKLAPSAYTLGEVVVSPQPPEEYIKEAISRIPENYASTPYNTKVYFREVIKLNGKYLNLTEAIMNVYNLPFTGNPADSTRLQLIALRHVNEQNEAIESIPLKRKKKKQDEIDSIIIQNVESMARQNGPYMLLDSNLIRRWHTYETSRVLGDFHFRFVSVMPYENRKLLNISYGDKKNEKREKAHGSLYLEENSLAIESYTYKYNTVPLAINAALFVFGYSMNDLEFSVKSTTQPTSNGYIDDLTILRADVDMEKMKIFKSNVPIQFEIEAIMMVLDYNFPATNPCTEGIIVKRGEALFKQAKPDPLHPIWEEYKNVILPEGTGYD